MEGKVDGAKAELDIRHSQEPSKINGLMTHVSRKRIKNGSAGVALPFFVSR